MRRPVSLSWKKVDGRPFRLFPTEVYPVSSGLITPVTKEPRSGLTYDGWGMHSGGRFSFEFSCATEVMFPKLFPLVEPAFCLLYAAKGVFPGNPRVLLFLPQQ